MAVRFPYRNKNSKAPFRPDRGRNRCKTQGAFAMTSLLRGTPNRTVILPQFSRSKSRRSHNALCLLLKKEHELLLGGSAIRHDRSAIYRTTIAARLGFPLEVMASQICPAFRSSLKSWAKSQQFHPLGCSRTAGAHARFYAPRGPIISIGCP